MTRENKTTTMYVQIFVIDNKTKQNKRLPLKSEFEFEFFSFTNFRFGERAGWVRR